MIGGPRPATAPPLRLEQRPQGASVLWIEGAGPAQNVFSATLADALDATLERVERERRPLVIASAKAHSFLAGADVEELAELADGAAGAALSARAQRIMDRVAALPVRTVAAISGACLGAGLELALACRVRLAAERADTRLGLPDVALGLVPGAGGSWRLPRTVGLVAALELLAGGRQLDAARALRLGLVDETVHPDALLEAALARAVGPPAARRRRAGLAERARTWLLEANPVGRAVVLARAEREAHVRSQGLLPAPVRVIQVVRAGQRRGRRAGLAAESHAFGELAVTRQARSLLFLFLAREAAELTGVGDKTRPVAKVAVVGAGLTGAEIAEVTAHEAKLPVRLRDLDRAALAEALRTIRRRLDGRRSVSLGDATRVLDRITTTTGRSGFGDADLVIEAVADELDVKRQVLSELETLVADTAVLATTTSSLPVRELAAALALPARLVGMHYVSPVGRSPLLEVVAGPATAPDVVATAVALGRAQGRTVIVVRDGPGFYTSRVLGRWLAVAAGLLAEGQPVDHVDRALEQAGFPVGPFRLVDEVGLHVAAQTAEVLERAFGARLSRPAALVALAGAGRAGRTGELGFYRYEDGRRLGVNPVVYDALGVAARPTRPAHDIAARCLAAFADEAARCLEEGVVASAVDADLAACLGLGFPAALGGPFHYVDRCGAAAVLARVADPAPLLRRRVEDGAWFFSNPALPVALEERG